VQNRHNLIEFAGLLHGCGPAEAARERDSCEVDARTGVAPLHSRFAVMLVIDHHDRQILRPFHSDRGEGSQTHQHFAVAGKDQHATLRLRESKS
jgi:hypothetical protein